VDLVNDVMHVLSAHKGQGRLSHDPEQSIRIDRGYILQGTNISPPKMGLLKMMFLFPRWDMLVP